MSIKPVAWMRPNGTHVDYYRHEGYLPLYAIPDTHRVVSVELLKEAVGQLSELNTFAAIRAIIEDKP
jgi:hypothetical protein